MVYNFSVTNDGQDGRKTHQNANVINIVQDIRNKNISDVSYNIGTDIMDILLQTCTQFALSLLFQRRVSPHFIALKQFLSNTL
jgi:hypothetical protein